MKSINKLTSNDIKKMSYNEIIGITRETNRPPGGISSLIKIVNTIFINKKTKILEIGTSTGFTALELSRLVDCEITAIDINKLSLNEAKKRAKKLQLKNVIFKEGNVENLNFPREYFDVVIVGNVFSLLNKRETALSECVRVLKNNGYLIAIPMYYVKNPPKNLVFRVSDAIKAKIKIQGKEYWENFFKVEDIEFFKTFDYIFDYISNKKINQYVNKVFSSTHLYELRKETRKDLNKRYLNFIKLFRDNLSYMGYSIFILRKTNFSFDEELFTSTGVRK